MTVAGGWDREKLLHCKSLKFGGEKTLELKTHFFIIPIQFYSDLIEFKQFSLDTQFPFT